MHANRTDGRCSIGATDPDCNRRVEALRIADAPRGQLEPQQLPWLLDEVDELRIALEAARGPELRRKPAAVVIVSRDVDHDLRVLSRLRREVIAGLADREPTTVWAPAPLMSELVRGTARNVV